MDVLGAEGLEMSDLATLSETVAEALPACVLAAEPDFTPTPEQIRESCEMIQAEWTPSERRQRECGRRRPLIRPVRCVVEIGVSHLGAVGGGGQ
jgi:hypothetical protein